MAMQHGDMPIVAVQQSNGSFVTMPQGNMPIIAMQQGSVSNPVIYIPKSAFSVQAPPPGTYQGAPSGAPQMFNSRMSAPMYPPPQQQEQQQQLQQSQQFQLQQMQQQQMQQQGISLQVRHPPPLHSVVQPSTLSSLYPSQQSFSASIQSQAVTQQQQQLAPRLPQMYFNTSMASFPTPARAQLPPGQSLSSTYTADLNLNPNFSPSLADQQLNTFDDTGVITSARGGREVPTPRSSQAYGSGANNGASRSNLVSGSKSLESATFISAGGPSPASDLPQSFASLGEPPPQGFMQNSQRFALASSSQQLVPPPPPRMRAQYQIMSSASQPGFPAHQQPVFMMDYTTAQMYNSGQPQIQFSGYTVVSGEPRMMLEDQSRRGAPPGVVDAGAGYAAQKSVLSSCPPHQYVLTQPQLVQPQAAGYSSLPMVPAAVLASPSAEALLVAGGGPTVVNHPEAPPLAIQFVQPYSQPAPVLLSPDEFQRDCASMPLYDPQSSRQCHNVMMVSRDNNAGGTMTRCHKIEIINPKTGKNIFDMIDATSPRKRADQNVSTATLNNMTCDLPRPVHPQVRSLSLPTIDLGGLRIASCTPDDEKSQGEGLSLEAPTEPDSLIVDVTHMVSLEEGGCAGNGPLDEVQDMRSSTVLSDAGAVGVLEQQHGDTINSRRISEEAVTTDLFLADDESGKAEEDELTLVSQHDNNSPLCYTEETQPALSVCVEHLYKEMSFKSVIQT